MEACSGGSLNQSFKLIIFMLLPLIINGRFCRDRDCEEPISEGRVIRDYDTKNENFMPVSKGETLFIISKSENLKLYEVEVGDSRGLVPAKYIKEIRHFINHEQLFHIKPMKQNLKSNGKKKDSQDMSLGNDKSAKKPTDRKRLLRFVQELENGMHATVKEEEDSADLSSENGKTGETSSNTDATVENSAKKETDRGNMTNEIGSNDSEEDDVGFKGAVTAPDTPSSENKDKDKSGASDAISITEWLKNPKFLKLRQRQLDDYLANHFSGREVTEEIRSLASELITNDLLTQVNNRESQLYQILREPEPGGEATDKGIEKSRNEPSSGNGNEPKNSESTGAKQETPDSQRQGKEEEKKSDDRSSKESDTTMTRKDIEEMDQADSEVTSSPKEGDESESGSKIRKEDVPSSQSTQVADRTDSVKIEAQKEDPERVGEKERGGEDVTDYKTKNKDEYAKRQQSEQHKDQSSNDEPLKEESAHKVENTILKEDVLTASQNVPETIQKEADVRETDLRENKAEDVSPNDETERRDDVREGSLQGADDQQEIATQAGTMTVDSVSNERIPEQPHEMSDDIVGSEGSMQHTEFKEEKTMNIEASASNKTSETTTKEVLMQSTEDTKKETIEDVESHEDPGDRLLALCHEHPHLEACDVLRGVKITRGTRDVDVREPAVEKEPFFLIGIMQFISGWICVLLKSTVMVFRGPGSLLGLDEAFEVTLACIDRQYSLGFGMIVFMMLMYPLIVSPSVRLALYLSRRNKPIKMRSDVEKSYIRRAEIATENCDKYRKEVEDAKLNLREERKQRDEAEHCMTELKDRIHELETAVRKEQNMAEANLSDLTSAFKEQEVLQRLIDEKEREIAAANLVASKHQKEIEDQMVTTTTLKSRLEEFQMELSLKDNEIGNLQTMLGTMEKEKLTLEELKEKLTEEQKDLESRLIENDKLIAEKEQEKENLEEQLEGKDTELEVLRGILLTINSGKNLDGETKDNYEAPEDDPDIQAEQLKSERLAKLMESTSALTKVKQLEEENKMLTEALGDEIEAKRGIEETHKKLTEDFEETSKNFKDYKAKSEASEIKLSTLRDYFHAQEAELHRKLAKEETARILSEKRLEESLADSTSLIREAESLKQQVTDLKDEIKDTERTMRGLTKDKDKEFHDLYIQYKQLKREKEEMDREREIYRRRLLEREETKRMSPTHARKPSSEGRSSPRDSVDGGRGSSPMSQQSGSQNNMMQQIMARIRAHYGPVPPPGMYGPMGGPPGPPPQFGPGGYPVPPPMMHPAVMQQAMMQRMQMAMAGGNMPPGAPSGPPSMSSTSNGNAGTKPPLRQRTSDVSNISVQSSASSAQPVSAAPADSAPPSGMAPTTATPLPPSSMAPPPSMQPPPNLQASNTFQPRPQYIRPVPRTSTPGSASGGSGQNSPAVGPILASQPQKSSEAVLDSRPAVAPGAFSTPQSSSNAGQMKQANRTFPSSNFTPGSTGGGNTFRGPPSSGPSQGRPPFDAGQQPVSQNRGFSNTSYPQGAPAAASGNSPAYGTQTQNNPPSSGTKGLYSTPQAAMNSVVAQQQAYHNRNPPVPNFSTGEQGKPSTLV